MFESYDTNANAANTLRPIGEPWYFFSKMTILAGGQILEDIDLYNRVHEMFNKITAEGSRYKHYSEGFGNVLEGFQDRNVLNGAVNNGSALSIIYLPGIPGASYQTVLFKPLSKILNQRKYIPLRSMSITIEVSLVDVPLDPIISFFTNKQAGAALPANAFTNAITSTTWQIQKVQVKSDLVSLDSGVNESYIKLLKEGKKLTLNYNTFISQY